MFRSSGSLPNRSTPSDKEGQTATKRLAWVRIAPLVLPGALPAALAAQNVSVRDVLAALGKTPTLGRPDAPVEIVEFSDFQCSFCRKFWAEALPKLKENYINQGKVRFVYRHFAILGKPSLRAANGAECAGEQGRFWEYHDRLFGNQEAANFTHAELKRYATELKLDARRFSQCLQSEKYGRKVRGETAVAGFLGARGTPTFFINGRMLVGAQPFEIFESAVEEKRKNTAPKKK